MLKVNIFVELTIKKLGLYASIVNEKSFVVSTVVGLVPGSYETFPISSPVTVKA